MLAKSLIVFAALAASVVAQPHGVPVQVSRHRAIAAGHGAQRQSARAAPVADAELNPAVQRMRKRKTCRPRTSQSAAPAASTPAASSSVADTQPSAPVNAGSKPTLPVSAPAVVPTSAPAVPKPTTKAEDPKPVTSSSAPEHESSDAPEPKPTTSSAAPEPKPTTSQAPEPKPTTSQAPEPKPTTSKAPEPKSTTSQAPEPKPTTSQAPEPKPTTSQAPEPAPAPTTSKPEPKPTTSTAADPKPTTGSGPSFLYGTQTGQGTFYNTGLVACGQTYSDSDHIAAVSHLLFDAYPGAGANPNSNPICGKKVRATYQGKSVDVAIVDRCTGCALLDLDFTPSAFNTIADPALGRISGVTWEWL